MRDVLVEFSIIDTSAIFSRAKLPLGSYHAKEALVDIFCTGEVFLVVYVAVIWKGVGTVLGKTSIAVCLGHH